MGAGKAVQLNETTKLVPVFDPRLRYFVAQLWQNGDVTAVLGEFGTCRHPDDVLDAVDDFLAEHGLAPLTESQVRQLARELIMAKGGPDAAMLLIAIEQAERAVAAEQTKRDEANERRAMALPCTISWASAAAYSTAALHDRHTSDGSPLVEVLVAALPDGNGEHCWNARDITLIYADGSVDTLSSPGSTFDEELSDIADRMALPIVAGMDLSIKTDKAALTDYQTTDVAAVAVRLLGPGWMDRSDPEAATMLRHADGTVVTLTEASTSSGSDLQVDASVEDRADIHESGCVDGGHLTDLLSAAEQTTRSISAMHRAVHAARGAAETTPLRLGLRYRAHAEQGGWIVKDSVSGFQAAKLPDAGAADMAAAALSLAALAGPAASLLWEHRRSDGSLYDDAEEVPTAKLTGVLTYHRGPEGAGTVYEWAPGRIVVRYPDGEVTTLRPVAP